MDKKTPYLVQIAHFVGKDVNFSHMLKRQDLDRRYRHDSVNFQGILHDQLPYAVEAPKRDFGGSISEELISRD